MIVVALDEAAGRRVVVVGGEGEAGVFADLEDGLNQALAEGGFADDQGAIMILEGAGDDLGREAVLRLTRTTMGKCGPSSPRVAR